MTARRVRVGIVGLREGQSWAWKAHLPALRALVDRFEIVGVANGSRTSAEAAAGAAGIDRAFDSVSALVASPDVDVVTITVKVPHHLALAKTALEAGKHVYCEWPLGNGLAEAEELAALARRQGVVAVVGTQARVAPEVQTARRLVAEGFVGEVLSSTLTATGGAWGATIETEGGGYILDPANGATMLAIPVGHMLAAVREVLGGVAEVSALMANRRPAVKALDTGNTLPKATPDQVLVSALLANGAPLSLHYRGGMPRGVPGLVWDIHGSEGDLRITGPLGHGQLVPLVLEGAAGAERTLRAIEVTSTLGEGTEAVSATVGNVARVYQRLAADLRDGSHTAPSFDDGVDLHRILSAIEVSASLGQRVSVATRARRE